MLPCLIRINATVPSYSCYIEMYNDTSVIRLVTQFLNIYLFGVVDCLINTDEWNYNFYQEDLMRDVATQTGHLIIGWRRLFGILSELMALQWRHNERDGVSNHLRLDCLFKGLFRRRSKKSSKLCVTGLCEGNSPVTGEFLTKRDSKVDFFPFDYVIISIIEMHIGLLL